MKKFCVIGTPVGHSKSPELFERFVSERGLVYGRDVVYIRNEIQTEEELQRFFNELKNGEWKGCNVTMTWKTDVAGLMDELSETALVTDSVNTVSFRNGKLYGDSTDGRGMLNAIEPCCGKLTGRHMVILGCGGAARSIIAEAVLRKMRMITIVCRGGSALESFTHDTKTDEENFTGHNGISSNMDLTLKMLRKLKKADTFIEFVDSCNTERILDSLNKADILINSTPVGMVTGNGDELKLPIPKETGLRKDLVVADCVYNPDETLLIKKAKEAGCMTVKGIRMLEEQARCGVDVLLSS